MKKKTFCLMTLIGMILITSCGASDSSLKKPDDATTTSQVQIVLPADQMSALVNSYVTSTIQSRQKPPKATNLSQLMECVNGAAINLGESLLSTFATQELANTAIMQQVQQNLERFIAQCSTN